MPKMKPKKTPEYIMINNHGKRELREISNIKPLKIPHGYNSTKKRRKLMLGLINYLEQEHKNGKLQQIMIKECKDRIILINLDIHTNAIKHKPKHQ